MKVAFRGVVGVYGVSRRALDAFTDIFGDYLPATAIRDVIYNSVDMTRFQRDEAKRQAVRAELGIPEQTPLLGSVARLDKGKQPLLTLEVFLRVLEHRPDAHFLFVGEGRLAEELERRITEAGVSESVTVSGFRSDVEAVFAGLDVHLLMSRNEGFGIVTAEALACGTPVVATNVSGTEEVIQGCEAAWPVADGDVDAAADAVVELLGMNTEERARLGEAARRHVAERFSYDAWKERTGAFYDRVLATVAT